MTIIEYSSTHLPALRRLPHRHAARAEGSASSTPARCGWSCATSRSTRTRSRPRCSPIAPARAHPQFVDVFFAQQASWARARDPVQALKQLAQLGGLGEAQVDACLADKALEDAVLQARLEGRRSSTSAPPRPSSSTARPMPATAPSTSSPRSSTRCCRSEAFPRAPAEARRPGRAAPCPNMLRAAFGNDQTSRQRLQVVLRSGRAAARGRAHRHRRPERLRQVQHRRGAALGHGRELGQGPARRRHGRRHLQRLGGAPGHDVAEVRLKLRGRPGACRLRRQRRARGGAPRSRAGARPARPTGSTAGRRAPATSSSCSPTPAPVAQPGDHRPGPDRLHRRIPAAAAGAPRGGGGGGGGGAPRRGGRRGPGGTGGQPAPGARPPARRRRRDWPSWSGRTGRPTLSQAGGRVAADRGLVPAGQGPGRHRGEAAAATADEMAEEGVGATAAGLRQV